jgi:uncharacterized protein YbjT (DUF2867 family)
LGLTVAITGPTGEIGMPLLRRLEQAEAVESVRGMARRPFRPEMYGWEKVAYRRGDVLDLDSLTALFAGADDAVDKHRRLRAGDDAGAKDVWGDVRPRQ